VSGVAALFFVVIRPRLSKTYKEKLDPQFGLVAEDVAKINADLVVRDPNGEIYTVRYDAVNAMLLNEFLKQHPRWTSYRGTSKYRRAVAERNTIPGGADQRAGSTN
jgi:hypothetical protein